jgi:hypothetical protein
MSPSDGPLTPTSPVPGVSIEVQAEHMRELRRTESHARRVALMHAWALSNSLSRDDMAIATNLTTSDVSLLIHESAQRDIARKGALAAEHIRRHMPS